jgi:hypothetical protein
MPIHSLVNIRYTIWVENNGRVGYAEAHGAAAARIRNDDDPVAEGHREADRLRHAGQGEAERLYPVRYRTGTSAPRGVEEEAAKVNVASMSRRVICAGRETLEMKAGREQVSATIWPCDTGRRRAVDDVNRFLTCFRLAEPAGAGGVCPHSRDPAPSSLIRYVAPKKFLSGQLRARF